MTSFARRVAYSISFSIAFIAWLVCVWPVGAQVSPPSAIGQWSSVMSWPAVAVHAHMLSNGKVLTWEFGSTASVWNPADGLFTSTPNNFTDVLCSGHIFLADGRLLSLGGWDRSTGALGMRDAGFFGPNGRAR